MDVLINVFVGLHIIGIAALLGGFFTQMKAMGKGEARIVPGMLHGALTMLVTGVALVGLNQADDSPVNNVKIGIKLALLVVILGITYVKRDDEKVSAPCSAPWACWPWSTSSSRCCGCEPPGEPRRGCEPDGDRLNPAGRSPKRAQAGRTAEWKGMYSIDS